MRDERLETDPEFRPTEKTGLVPHIPAPGSSPLVETQANNAHNSVLTFSCPPPVETGQPETAILSAPGPAMVARRLKVWRNWYTGLSLGITVVLLGAISLAFVMGRLDEITTLILVAVVSVVAMLGLFLFFQFLKWWLNRQANK